MDEQLGALSKCIVGGELRQFVDARITAEFFPDEKYKKVYIWLLQHWRQYGTPPTPDVAARAFPSYRWVDQDPQPVQYYIDQLRRRREYFIFMEALQQAATVAADDEEPEKPTLLRRILHDALVRSKTETGGSKDVDFVASYAETLARIGYRRDNPGLRGIPTGFQGLDEVTGGLQPEQFIVLTGVPKSGKSSFLLYMMMQVHLFGKVPMFFGFEMSNQEQEDRLTSLLSGVSLSKILNGELDAREWGLINKTLRQRKDMHPMLFSADATSTTTVSTIMTKISEYKPDVLFVDGLYLMSSDLDPRHAPKGSPAALTDISRSLKQLAQSEGIPVVASTQSLVSRSKGGLTMSSIGYTSAFAQDADVIFGVERQSDDAHYSKFHVIESRSGPRKEVYVYWDWATGTVQEVDPAQWTPQAKAAQGGFNAQP